MVVNVRAQCNVNQVTVYSAVDVCSSPSDAGFLSGLRMDFVQITGVIVKYTLTEKPKNKRSEEKQITTVIYSGKWRPQKQVRTVSDKNSTMFCPPPFVCIYTVFIEQIKEIQQVCPLLWVKNQKRRLNHVHSLGDLGIFRFSMFNELMVIRILHRNGHSLTSHADNILCFRIYAVFKNVSVI